jgi:hypothetical protein
VKKLLTILFLLLAINSFGQRPLVPGGWNESYTDITKGVGFFGVPAMIHLPLDYDTSTTSGATKRYPLIIMGHGSGQGGTDTAKVLSDGWEKNISNNGSSSYYDATTGITYSLGSDIPQALDKNGNMREAIIVVPQRSSYSYDPSWFPGIFENITSRFRIDSSMVYPYGFSAGNWPSSGIIANNSDTTYNRFISAIHSSSGATQDLTWAGVRNIGQRNIPYLAITGDNSGDDISYNEQQTREIDSINMGSPSIAPIHIVIAGQGHSNFDTRALNSATYSALGNKSVIQWLFQYTNPYATTWTPSGGGGGTAPTVTVDAKRTITQPLNVATLNGTAVAASGHTISTVLWSVISQPDSANATIRWPDRLTSPLSNSSQLYVCDLEKVGTYIIQLTATDDASNSTSANDTIIVAAEAYPPCNPTPKSIILDATTMSGGDQYFPYGTAHPALSSYLTGDTLKVKPRDANKTPYGLFSIGGLQGNPACPTVIENDGGVVYITNVRFGEYISGHQHTTSISNFRFTGTGFSDSTYGFNINSADTGRPCLSYTLVHHAEFDHIYMKNGAPGIYGKITPDTTTANRPYVNFPAYVMRKIRIHDVFIDSTHGEGMYLGDYDRNGDVDHTDATGKRMLACIGDTLEVDHNIFKHTKWTACQFTSWRYALLHDNVVTDYGYSNTSSHQAGLAFGGYNNGSIYNNSVSNGTGNAYQIFGFGRIYFYNNTATNSAQQSIFGTDAPDSVQYSPNQEDSIYNNQINHPNTTNGVFRFNADHGITSNVWYSNNKFCFGVTPPVGWATGTTYLMSAAMTTARTNNIEYCISIIISRSKVKECILRYLNRNQ